MQLKRINTAKGQIAHVNLRNHNSLFAWLFLLSFILIIGYGNYEYKNRVQEYKSRHSEIKTNSHYVFVLDRSGSMSGQPMKDLERGYSSFINERLKSGTTSDSLSVIAFDDDVQIKYKNVGLNSSKKNLDLTPGGLTSYSKALNKALEYLKLESTKKPVLVFMTDGMPTDYKSDIDKSINDIKTWASTKANGFEGYFMHYGYGGGEAYVHYLSDQFKGTYHKCANGEQLEKTFKNIADWSSYDDLGVSFLSSIFDHGITVTVPLIFSIIVFTLFLHFLNVFGELLILGIFLAFPVCTTSVLLVVAHTFLSQDPYIEYAVVALIAVVAVYVVYLIYKEAKFSTAALKLGTNVVATFSSILPMQAGLLVVWAIWVKYVSYLVLKVEGNDIASAVYLQAGSFLLDNSYFLSPWSLAYKVTTSAGFYLSVQVAVCTGVMFAVNDLVVSRASAAIFFNFVEQYPAGGISLYSDVAQGALGTAVISGLAKATIEILDRSLEMNEYVAKLLWKLLFVSGGIIGILIVAPGYVLYKTFIDKTGTSDINESIISFLLKSYYTYAGISLLCYAYLLPFIRNMLKKALDASNFLVVVVAGVTGNSFYDSLMEAINRLSKDGVHIASTGYVITKINGMAALVLPVTSLALSFFFLNEMGLVAKDDYEPFIIGSIVAVTFLKLALDTLFTSTIGCLLCLLIQRSSDKDVIPGSPESKRVKSKVEIEALALIDELPPKESYDQRKVFLLQQQQEEEEEPVTPRGRSSAKSLRKINASRSPSSSRKKKTK